MYVHLIPETPETGPLWACGEIRLVRPYSHPRLANRLRISVGRVLERERIDVVVTQRGGPVGLSFQHVILLVAEIKRRKIKLIYDLDDDLLAEHPDDMVEAILEKMRPKVRFLIREADTVTVSTQILADRIKKLNENVVVLCNALDEALIPPLNLVSKKADLGYFGTNSHLKDFMAIAGSLAHSAAKRSRRPRVELCGITDDSRFLNVLNFSMDVGARATVSEYRNFHAVLAKDACWGIGLAPLLNGAFNEAKSGIKALDYAAAGIPAVVANVNAYSDFHNNKTLIRVPLDQMAEAAFELLDDEDRRRQLVRDAYDDLVSNHTLARKTDELALHLDCVLDRSR